LSVLRRPFEPPSRLLPVPKVLLNHLRILRWKQ
jgi:hypothetical protein